MPRFAVSSSAVFVALCASLVGAPCRAAVYTTGVALNGDILEAWTEPNHGGDGAQILLSLGPDFKLTPTNYTVGVGHVWYDVTPGVAIDPAFAASAPPFANAFTGYLGGSIQTELNVPFLLGFWLDANEDEIPNLNDRFGWARLERIDADTIVLLDSAIESTGSGLYAGTTQAVPEPASLALATFGLAALLLTRRRR